MLSVASVQQPQSLCSERSQGPCGVLVAQVLHAIMQNELREAFDCLKLEA